MIWTPELGPEVEKTRITSKQLDPNLEPTQEAQHQLTLGQGRILRLISEALIRGEMGS